MTSFIDVLMYKYNPSDWVINGSSYNDVVWLGSDEKPSIEFLNSQIDEVDNLRRFAFLREERKRLLVESDWTQVNDAPVDRDAWAEYRQALRDLPANTVDPENPVWPTPPE